MHTLAFKLELEKSHSLWLIMFLTSLPWVLNKAKYNQLTKFDSDFRLIYGSNHRIMFLPFEIFLLISLLHFSIVRSINFQCMRHYYRSLQSKNSISSYIYYESIYPKDYPNLKNFILIWLHKLGPVPSNFSIPDLLQSLVYKQWPNLLFDVSLFKWTWSIAALFCEVLFLVFNKFASKIGGLGWLWSW